MQVSVIIPTYNSAQYLDAAVKSVLEQTFTDYEILIIDDGSTDKTEEVIKQFGDSVRYIRQKNQGVSVARNLGIKESVGKYVAFLDADDVWLPAKLEKQILALEKAHDSKVCYTEYISVSDDMKPTELKRLRTNGSVLNDLLLRGNVVGPPSALMCERVLFEKLGGFDSNLSLCADWEMWFRLSLATDLFFLKEPLVKYRLHDSNMSKNVKLLEEDTVRLLEKSFAIKSLPNKLKTKRKEAFAYHYIVLAKSYFRAGQYADFLRCVVRSISWDVTQIGHLRSSARIYNKQQTALKA